MTAGGWYAYDYKLRDHLHQVWASCDSKDVVLLAEWLNLLPILEAERDALAAEVEAARQSEAKPLYWYNEAKKLAAEVERVKAEYGYVITRAPAAKYEAALRGILEHEPHEIAKDKFAYDRMVDAYRDAARAALADGATIEGVGTNT